MKPEADIAPTTTPLSLDTYAHWKAITRQALEDYARIRSIVEGKLRVGLAKKLESVAAGVINAAAFATGGGSRCAKRDSPGNRCRAGERISAECPARQSCRLCVSRYRRIGRGRKRADAIRANLGSRPVPVPSIPEGTSFVGDFTEAVTWFDRNTTGVFMTDSHADYFVRNLLLVLAETRAAFAATNLEAAVKVTVSAAATASASSK